MALATSQNLTYLGVGTILAALGVAVTEFANGGLASINWGTLMTAIVLGVGFIMAKGQANTGGTIATTVEAQTRVTSPGLPKV